jgi:ATP-binding cassette subfamily E protein 1
LTTNCTHKYGPNSFKLHGLPAPRPGHVLGLLGTNGTGKSTALNILLGRTKPNLGKATGVAPDWEDIVTYYRGSSLQNYFTGILENTLRVVIKPQLEARFAKRLSGKKVRDMMEQRDERKIMDRVAKELELEHVLDREIQQLSGGELQRFAVAVTLMRDADVYMFDEVSSFLDVKQRLTVTQKIRNLVHNAEEWPNGELDAMKKYVVSILCVSGCHANLLNGKCLTSDYHSCDRLLWSTT